MANLPTTLSLSLPPWFRGWVETLPRIAATDEEAMRLAIEAARRNIEAGTGGPFGALVLDDATREILSVGINVVVSAQGSPYHAEIVAMLLAQKAAGTHDLGLDGTRRTTLFTSAEPCAMCMGAIPWSGITRVVIAARDVDVRQQAEFDEGDKPADWVAAYQRRGITVVRDLLRDEASAILRRYRTDGGPRY